MKGDFLLKRKDLTGNKYGKLTVKKMLYNYNNTNRTKCLCDCDCGNTDILRESYQLTHAIDSSCGCGKKEYIRKSCGKEINGQKFGKLLILDTLWDNNPPMVYCYCDCGNTILLNKKDVQTGHTKSCGCLKIDIFNEINNVNHSGEISDYGITILNKSSKNKYNQQLWNCKCFCGNIFEELPARILNGHVRSCGCLKTSSGELLIKNILNNNNINYKQEYTFPDCKGLNNYVLRFDFGIIRDNNLKCLFEFDGQQHFYPIEFFGGEKGYQDTKIRDNIKNQYCNIHNIPLYRFNYKMRKQEIEDKIINILNP